MRKKFISFSGGVESTTMCLLYGSDAKAIFADAGWEHEAMYERLVEVEAKLKAIHPNFEIIRVKNKKYPEGLPQYIREHKFYPSPKRRYCTAMFKIDPIDEFLSEQGKCDLLIGLNADEVGRVGNHGLKPNVNYQYPLIKDDLTRQDCINLLIDNDLLPKLPVYMQRGGCVGCFFKSKKEFVAMSLLNPKEFNEVESIEKEIQDQRGVFYSIRSDMSMEQLRKNHENLLFDSDMMYEAYIKMDSVQGCGVFCNR